MNLLSHQLAQILRVAAAWELREEQSETVVARSGDMFGSVGDLVADEVGERSLTRRLLLFDVNTLVKQRKEFEQKFPLMSRLLDNE